METKEERMARIQEENTPWVYCFQDEEIVQIEQVYTQNTTGLIQQAVYESFQLLKEMKAPRAEYIKVLKWAAREEKRAWVEEIELDKLKGWKIA
jgi:phosphoribosylanthranilate isomerase